MTFRSAAMFLAMGALVALAAPARANDPDYAALGKAMTGVSVTLDKGLVASQAQGTPISAKFELENGALQLSVYTKKGGDFMEVIVDHKTGSVAKSEKITDAGDLKDAAVQDAAMAKAKMTLDKAVQDAVEANAGFVAVSAMPEGAAAMIILLKGAEVKKVTQKLD